jgi:hypothetical protein
MAAKTKYRKRRRKKQQLRTVAIKLSRKEALRRKQLGEDVFNDTLYLKLNANQTAKVKTFKWKDARFRKVAEGKTPYIIEERIVIEEKRGRKKITREQLPTDAKNLEQYLKMLQGSQYIRQMEDKFPDADWAFRFYGWQTSHLFDNNIEALVRQIQKYISDDDYFKDKQHLREAIRHIEIIRVQKPKEFIRKYRQQRSEVTKAKRRRRAIREAERYQGAGGFYAAKIGKNKYRLVQRKTYMKGYMKKVRRKMSEAEKAAERKRNRDAKKIKRQRRKHAAFVRAKYE